MGVSLLCNEIYKIRLTEYFLFLKYVSPIFINHDSRKKQQIHTMTENTEETNKGGNTGKHENTEETTPTIPEWRGSIPALPR